MTVKELIARLQKLPKSNIVHTEGFLGGHYETKHVVRITKDEYGKRIKPYVLIHDGLPKM